MNTVVHDSELHSFTCGYPAVPVLFVEVTFFPLEGLGTFVKNQLIKKKKSQLIINVRVYFWALNLIPLSYKAILVPVSQSQLL